MTRTGMDCHGPLWEIAMLLAVWSIAAPASADSYIMPNDFEVVCLERATGRIVWRTKPKGLPSPRLTLVDDILVAEEKDPPEEGQQRKKRGFFDVRTGQILEPRPGPSAEATTRIGPMAPLPQNLERSDGTRYEFREGTTRHLIAVVDGKKTLVKYLEDFPVGLHIFENLALFTFARAGGEVYAYRLIEDRLAWEFHAWREIEVAERGYTGIALDGERVLVSTAQTVFALDVHTGEILWMSALPKQNIRRYDGPRTKVARLADNLLVNCYEDLFLLKAVDGSVLWAFDCGPFAEAWPTVRGKRCYLAARGDFRGLERPEIKRLPKDLVTTVSRLPSAVVLSRDGTGYALRFVSRRDLPAGKDVWWSLRPPPPPRGKDSYTLVFFRNYKNESTTIDVTVPLLSQQGNVIVKYNQQADKVFLLRNGEVILKESVPSRWPPPSK